MHNSYHYFAKREVNSSTGPGGTSRKGEMELSIQSRASTAKKTAIDSELTEGSSSYR